MCAQQFGSVGSRATGTTVSTQLQEGFRRGITTSTKGSEQSGTFNFDALPTFFKGWLSEKTKMSRMRPFSLSSTQPQTSPTEPGQQCGISRRRLAGTPKTFVGRT